jgi:hypothetical protein
MAYKKGDQVTIIGHDEIKKLYRDWGIVHRVARDQSWADVIVGRYCCVRIPTCDLLRHLRKGESIDEPNPCIGD